MSIDSILAHMNSHHVVELGALVKHYGGFEAKDIRLVNVTSEGLSIVADNRDIFAPFPSRTEEKDYRDAIIKLCMSLPGVGDVSSKNGKVLEEIEKFKEEFNTVLISSLSKDNKASISYSPLLRYENNYYLYISEVAEHCANLRVNPTSAQAMFIEDEKQSATLLARKRLTYDIAVEFLPKDTLFEKVFDAFEARVGKGGGVSQVRNMQDFHLVKVHFKTGRFVKGFGQAFVIKKDGSLQHLGAGGSGSPHKNPHSGVHGNPHGSPHSHKA